MHDTLYNYITSRIELSNDDWLLIKESFLPISLKKKEFLLKEGDECLYLWFVVKGCLRMYKEDSKGHEHIIQFSFEEYWLNDREAVTNHSRSKCFIEAIEPCDLLQIEMSRLNELYKLMPHFREMHLNLQQRNFTKVQERIEVTLSYSAEEKYADLMAKQPELLNRVPLSMVASYLGISRETLSRIRAQQGKKRN